MEEPASGDGTARIIDGRYRLDAELGRGGMGRVWRAYDTRLNRIVAVKELLPAQGMDAAEHKRLAERMEREATAAAMGSHPSIVAVHDVVEYEDRPWIVMEMLSGRSLQQLVGQCGPLPPAQVAVWGYELADALFTAHNLGIVHRDVKPANVMITDSSRAVLTDFGIAQVAGASELTGTMGLVGSPGYMAPERLQFTPATPAADLWSLGATLYYAVEGQAPFRRGTVEETVRASLEDEANLSRATGQLAELIGGLLRKDPAERLDAARVRSMLSMPAPVPAPAQVQPAGAAPTATLTGNLPPAPDPGAATAVTGGPATAVQPAPAQRSTWMSWPVATVILGLAALLVVAAGILVFAPDSDSADPGQVGQAAAQRGDEEDADEGASPSPSESEEPEPPPGTSVVSDPAGFDVVVPDGWTRREDGTSIYYDAPQDGVYLQIDTRPHPNDDQLAHVQQSERETVDSGRLPSYARIRMEDVTDAVGGEHQSVAEWEFTWNNSGEERRILTRNFTTSDGGYVTVAWATPSSEWDSLADLGGSCLNGFTP